MKILSIGGEIQVKKKGSTRKDDDEIYDLADVRVLTVGDKNRTQRLFNFPLSFLQDPNPWLQMREVSLTVLERRLTFQME